MNPCPSLEALRQLLADELSGPEAETVEGHLEACVGCQQALERLTAAADWTAAAAGAGPDFLRRLGQEPPTVARPFPDLPPANCEGPAVSMDRPAVPGY